MSNFDKVFLVIEGLIGGHVVLLHDDSKGYVFKTYSGEWKRVSFEFANYIAGLGEVNRSLL